MIELNRGHEVNKDYLIHYVLNLFVKKNFYEHCCWCETCKEVKKLKSLPLFCRCIWTKFGEELDIVTTRLKLIMRNVIKVIV